MWFKNTMAKATTKLEAAGFNWYDVGSILISGMMLGGQIVGIWLGNKSAKKHSADLANMNAADLAKLMATLQQNATPPTTPNE